MVTYRKGEAFRPQLPADPCSNPRHVQTVLDGMPSSIRRTAYTVLDSR